LYAATSSKVFKTIDSGGSWTGTAQNVFFAQSIAIDPSTPTTLYAASNTSSGGIFKSTDGGVNWQAVNNGLTTSFLLSVAVDPITPSTVYAGANGGLFKSVNGGSSWTSITTGLANTFVSSIAIDPVTPSTIYVGGSGFIG